MALRVLPNFGNFFDSRRQGQRVDGRRAADDTDDERELTIADMPKAQRRPAVPTVTVEGMPRDRRNFPRWVDGLFDPMQLAGEFQLLQVLLQIVVGHGSHYLMGLCFRQPTQYKNTD